MRFDKKVDIFIKNKISDEQGGFIEREVFDNTVKANVYEMPIEFVQKVYGTTMMSVLKVVLFAKYNNISKVRYEGKLYSVVRYKIRNNKTYLTLEEDNG